MSTPLGSLSAEALGELGRQRLDGHAEPAARHLALGRQLRVDPLGHVDGDGEADADIAAGAREDRAVDADDLARHVDERAARVARVDGGVGLEEVVEGALADRAPLGADDARRHRLLEAEGRADGQHPVADLDLVGVAEGGRGEGAAALEPQHGEIGALVDARRAWPCASCRPPSTTSISVARSTTWALVSTMPDGSTMTPEPRLRAGSGRSGASPKKRRKNSSPKNSSIGVRPAAAGRPC